MEGFPGVKAHQTLGKVYCVLPSAEERFFLRMLLYEVKSPCSFEESRTVGVPFALPIEKHVTVEECLTAMNVGVKRLKKHLFDIHHQNYVCV